MRVALSSRRRNAPCCYWIRTSPEHTIPDTPDSPTQIYQQRPRARKNKLRHRQIVTKKNGRFRNGGSRNGPYRDVWLWGDLD